MRSSKPGRSRSKKAGSPPVEGIQRPQAARRRRSAHAAMKKDTTMLQTDQGTKLIWGAGQPKPRKRSP